MSKVFWIKNTKIKQGCLECFEIEGSYTGKEAIQEWKQQGNL